MHVTFTELPVQERQNRRDEDEYSASARFSFIHNQEIEIESKKPEGCYQQSKKYDTAKKRNTSSGQRVTFNILRSINLYGLVVCAVLGLQLFSEFSLFGVVLFFLGALLFGP